ncbi:MAG: DUF2066 domain-containing protein [Magnetococcales bacterium]|nr:DUF2066 domain-containing protein [Magnetococcales bacterium]
MKSRFMPLWFTLVVTVLSAVISAPVLAQTSAYLLEGVPVVVPLPLDDGLRPRQVAIVEAEKKAWSRFMSRAVARSEQREKANLFNMLQKDLGPLVKRTIVQSERRKVDGSAINYVVDVEFSRKDVLHVFRKEHVSYNETPYPQVLMVTARKKGNEWQRYFDPMDSMVMAFQKAAAPLGLNVVVPLGDVDDMVNLPWSQIEQGSPGLQKWADSRYGAGQVWGVGMTVSPLSSKESKVGKVAEGQLPSTHKAYGMLLAFDQDGGVTSHKASAEGLPLGQHLLQDYPSVQEIVAAKLMQRVVDQWVQDNSVVPGDAHGVEIVVRHNTDLKRLAVFMHLVQRLPGITDLLPAQLSAQQSVLRATYQGADQRLMDTLIRKGWATQSADGKLIVQFQ